MGIVGDVYGSSFCGLFDVLSSQINYSNQLKKCHFGWNLKGSYLRFKTNFVATPTACQCGTVGETHDYGTDPPSV